MTIYKDIELKACLEQAGFYEVQIQKKSGSASRRGRGVSSTGIFASILHMAIGMTVIAAMLAAIMTVLFTEEEPMKCKMRKTPCRRR